MKLILRVENNSVAMPKELQEFENKLDITFSLAMDSSGRQSATLTKGDCSLSSTTTSTLLLQYLARYA